MYVFPVVSHNPPGTDPRQAIAEVKQVVDRLQITVLFTFESVPLRMSPQDSLDSLINEWKKMRGVE